jgi:hypothetical protein
VYTDTGDIEDDEVETPTFERYEDDTDGEVKHAPDADEEDITPEETDEYCYIPLEGTKWCLDEFVEGSETGKGRSTEPGTRIPYLTLVHTYDEVEFPSGEEAEYAAMRKSFEDGSAEQHNGYLQEELKRQ